MWVNLETHKWSVTSLQFNTFLLYQDSISESKFLLSQGRMILVYGVKSPDKSKHMPHEPKITPVMICAWTCNLIATSNRFQPTLSSSPIVNHTQALEHHSSLRLYKGHNTLDKQTQNRTC